MDWQLTVVALSVAGAVVYLGRQTWRTWSAKGCGGCGCGGKKASAGTPGQAAPLALIPVEHLTLRSRSRPGERDA